MDSEPLLFLDARDVADLLDYPSCIGAVEDAFRCHALGQAPEPALCGIHVADGGFHVKAAVLETTRPYFAAKTNANFPGNPARYGAPTVQGLVLLFDAGRGTPLAVIDSGEITIRRTAAATAVAARRLARAGSATLTVCGCGVQGRAHIDALRHVLPLAEVFVYDADEGAAHRLAEDVSEALRLTVRATRDLSACTRASDVCVTCTPSRDYVLRAGDVEPGAFVAGVGVDNPEKRELAPDLLARGRVVVDLLEQCATLGDLHHALDAGAMRRESVHAELGEVVAGRKPGRTTEDEIFIFDSTGTALQDVAAAAVVYERARRQARGLELSRSSQPLRPPP